MAPAPVEALPRISVTGARKDVDAETRALNGKTLFIPSIPRIFATWPSASSRHERHLRQYVDVLLESVVQNPTKLAGMKQADFSNQIALWCPSAEWEQLMLVTAFTLWLWIWDDEVDEGITIVSRNGDEAREYYAQSREYMQQCLGLKVKPPGSNASIHPNMRLFSLVGDASCKSTDKIQRTRFYKELDHYMTMVEVEHELRVGGLIPDTGEYLKVRLGSAGVLLLVAITGYILRIRLPESIMTSKAMRAIWEETTVINMTMNDIYSCPKEIAQHSLMNIIPVLWMNMPPEEQSLEAVAAECIKIMAEAKARFEAAAKDLDVICADDSVLRKDTANFVQWCRYFSTGVMYWSMGTQRYGIKSCVREDGTIELKL
ncbi:isoprenoid synthase domain-containing protein [Roridomyces roridus]|uniref:Terpene synthase n=1 Tax=Roridomyces roridus TaxID=1738132 RepID=A0AAD7CDT9_9AGAR|nr:isoprenoid synthase domain-containing protein [Roridomyces roridus]